MKNQWIEFYSGIVSVRVSGKGIERLVNKLIRNDITIWNVKRHGKETVIFNVKLGDIKRLRIAARNCGCKIRFKQRVGVPFLFKKLLSNSGLIVGAVLFLITIFLLSNMVWGIEIKGANPATEHQIRKELDKMGIKTGKFQFFIEEVEGIQRNLTNRIQALTWVGVELKGTTYHFQVVEKKTPKQLVVTGPQHLVAKKEAVITKIFVEKGKQLVNRNDHVAKGQLLVSGLIGKEGQLEQVSATGEILGETWYKSYVELPLKSNFHVFNGNSKRKFALNVGKISIPVWGFGKPNFKEFEVEETTRKFNFLYWELPIKYQSKTIRERETVTRVYSNKEAISKAKEIARKDIKKGISEDATIIGENVLHQSIENGKVKLSIHFQIIENIAEGQPIIQGDEE